MNKLKNENIFSKILFFLTSVFSYFIFLVFYDSTTGYDFYTKYSNYIFHFAFAEQLQAMDGQGIVYYFFISQIVKFNSHLIGPFNDFEILNNSIQFGNYIIVLIGYLGIFKYFKSLKFIKIQIFYILSFLNFFPPLIYLRLTFKSEVLAFALFPWLLYTFEKIKNEKNNKLNIYFFQIIFLLILTIKPSITVMVAISFLILEYKSILNYWRTFLYTGIMTIFFLYFNFLYIKVGFLSQKFISDAWDNRATFSFFFNFNFLTLLKEPFFDKQSNSFLSVLLLDTYSDYFKFFWKHEEITNYLAYNQKNYFNNFFINRYLRDYIAIFLSAVTYFGTLTYLIFSKKNNKKIASFSFIGILVLVVNSLGIPNNNFNPLTADTFKIHYFAFLLSVSVAFLLLYNLQVSRLALLLIPICIFVMGFPKSDLNSNINLLTNKLSNSEFCYIFMESKSCRNEFINICKDIPIKKLSKYELIDVDYFSYPQPFSLEKGSSKIYVTNSYNCLTLFNDGYKFNY